MYQLMIDRRTGEINLIKRIADNAFIPMDEANSDYAAYLKWLDEGNEPSLPDEQSPA